MSASASVVAQAKINLRLRVLAREQSGYHSIETILLRLDLGDDVRVRVASGRSLDCAGSALPSRGLGPQTENLAYRAAAAYVEATGWPDGFAIEVVKNIPVGGGLGGGSADAGAVLRALDALAPRPLGKRLPRLATALGADVPFMAIEHPMALAWGRGERMLPLVPPEGCHVALVHPGFGVNTGAAYSWLANDRETYQPESDLIDPMMLTAWESIASLAVNDFEPVVIRRYPAIGTIVNDLNACGATLAMMTGSGSTVFGLFDDPDSARAAERTIAGSLTLTRTATLVAPVIVE